MTLPDPSTFIARGASAEVFRVEAGFVLKLFHDGIDPGIVAREYAIACAVQDMGLPVARAVEQRVVGGRPGIVYSEIEGPNLLHYIRRHPARGAWALRAMARLQADIHDRHVPALRSRRAVLREDIEASDLDERLRAAAVDRLEQLVEGDRLSHGDLHPANLIVTPQGLAVIDWSKAARSAPAADVVRTEMLMRFGPGLAGARWEGAMRDAATGYVVRQYRKATGMEPEALAAWRALVALAWVRHRLPGRDAAFVHYIQHAVAEAGLPPWTP